MVNRVIDHLGDGEMPNVTHVFREIRYRRREMLTPNNVLLEALAQKGMIQGQEHLQAIDPGACTALSFDQAITNERLQIAICHLPRQSKLGCETCSDTMVFIGGYQLECTVTNSLFVKFHTARCKLCGTKLTSY